MVAAALLFPVLIFIGTATRLSAARREQRFAAMRLVGATPRQVAVIATVESTRRARRRHGRGLRAVLRCPRPPLAAIPFTGEPFFTGDLVARPWSTSSLVALGVPFAAAVAARFALRRVRISPLGVSRRATPAAAARLAADPAARSASAELPVLRRPAARRPRPGQISAYLPGVPDHR